MQSSGASHRNARQPARAGAGRHGAGAAGGALAAEPGLAAEASSSRSSAPPATRSRTGRSPRSAARACSPRRSRRRCSPARSISRCIRRRTCRPLLPPGLAIVACCRARTRATCSSAARPRRCASCRTGAVVGTASLRRQALVKRLRPDLTVVTVPRQCGDAAAQARRRRGRRDAAGARGPEAARARGGRRPRFSIPRNSCRRSGRASSRSRRGPTTRARARCSIASTAPDDATALAAERAFLAVLDGSCRTPIAGHATITAGRVSFRGLIAKPDGSEAFETTREGAAARRVGARRRRRPRAEASAPAPTSSRRRETPCASSSPDPSPTASARRRRCARAAATCCWRRCLRIEASRRGRSRRGPLGCGGDDQRQCGACDRASFAPPGGYAAAGVHGRPPHRRGRSRRRLYATWPRPMETSRRWRT